MSVLKAALNQFSEKKYSGFVLVLIFFLILRLITAFSFYNGFILNFPKIAEVSDSQSFFSKILLFVPYHSFSICLSSLQHPLFLIALVMVYVPLFYKKQHVNFNKNLFLKHDKVIVFVASFILSWELSTYDYNYYLNNAFYFDRFLLLVLPFLIWRFPIFTPLYIAFAMVYRSQFNYPIDGFGLFDKRILFDILLMYVALAYVKIHFKKANIHFIYFVLCIVASNYFITGVSKITMSPHGYEWLLYNKLSDLFLNAHARGWLYSFNAETINTISIFLGNQSVLLQILIVILEMSALILLKNVRTGIVLLFLLCFMHIGIFLAGSMLFWKWITINLVLAIVLWKEKKYFEELLFTKKMFRISVLIILTSFIWLRPYTIGWFDTRVNQYFTYEAEDENGKIVEVAKNELNPYHQWFQYDRFLFLVNKKCLPVSGFGYTNQYSLKARLDTVLSENSIYWLQTKYGINHYDNLKRVEFNNFIKTFFANRNNLNGTGLIVTKLSPPHHLNNSVSGSGLSSLGKVTKFKVLYNLSFNQNGKVKRLIKQVVDEIHI